MPDPIVVADTLPAVSSTAPAVVPADRLATLNEPELRTQRPTEDFSRTSSVTTAPRRTICYPWEGGAVEQPLADPEPRALPAIESAWLTSSVTMRAPNGSMRTILARHASHYMHRGATLIGAAA